MLIVVAKRLCRLAVFSITMTKGNHTQPRASPGTDCLAAGALLPQVMYVCEN